MFHLCIFLFSAILFYVLTPGILLTIPKKSSKTVVALVHALVYATVWHFTHKIVWEATEGFAVVLTQAQKQQIEKMQRDALAKQQEEAQKARDAALQKAALPKAISQQDKELEQIRKDACSILGPNASAAEKQKQGYAKSALQNLGKQCDSPTIDPQRAKKMQEDYDKSIEKAKADAIKKAADEADYQKKIQEKIKTAVTIYKPPPLTTSPKKYYLQR